MNIIDAINSGKVFGSLFKDQETWANWKVFLKSLFGLGMNEQELAVFKEYTGRGMAHTGSFSEAFAIVGRRGGKSFISAVIACYLALFHDWRQYLAPGEVGWIMVIASDKLQARVILNYIRGILRLPIFKGMIKKDLTWDITLNNQIIIEIKTCDYRTLRGYTVVAAICDEIAFWRSEGANPSQEILTALRPSLATIPGSLLLGISTPYSKVGPLYEAFRDKYGQDDSNVLVWRAPTLVMNPTIKTSLIDRELKADPSGAKAEWLAEFREDLESFLSTEMIEACVIPGRFELPKIQDAHYYAFADPSGGRADSFTLGIAHKESNSNKIILDRVEERHPPFNPQAVVAGFSAVMKEYGISEVSGDKYAGEWVTESFKKEGVYFKSSELSKSEIYLEFEPLIAQGAVDLLDNKKLINQLRSLERRTRSGGRDLIDHPVGFHDDIANAAAGACVLVSQGGRGEAAFEVIPYDIWPD